MVEKIAQLITIGLSHKYYDFIITINKKISWIAKVFEGQKPEDFERGCLTASPFYYMHLPQQAFVC